MNADKRTMKTLYGSITYFKLKGSRFFINFGPIHTVAKYAKYITNIGTGVPRRNQSLTLESMKK